MGHQNKKTLVKQVSDELDAQFREGKGRPKHIDKQTADGTTGRMYSESTLATYKKHACYFVKWAKGRYKCRTLEECRPYAAEWIRERGELSAWTQKTEAAALAKLYRCSAGDLGIVTPPRKRENIKRSRSGTKTDAHFSESKNRNVVTFGKCTGLRRRELGRIRGNCLIIKSGQYYLTVTEGTKGKRPRVAPIVGSPEEVQLVVDLCRTAGDRRVFNVKGVPHNMDEHGNRREYANRVYQAHKRPLETLENRQKYFCRGSMKGVVYDRQALYRVTEALGHGRIGIVPTNYAPDP